jgi:hypothetical protein
VNSKNLSITFLLTFSLIILLSPTVLADISYAQLLQPLRPSQTPSQVPQTPSQVPPSTAATLPENAVTITSPQDGQKVAVGQDLEVTGTSMANAASGCKITVNLNRVKPYQPAVAAGPGGPNDYSQWSFTITSQYAPIQEGQNRVAAKIDCGVPQQFAHVNVTGVAGETSGNTGSTVPEPTAIPGLFS